MLMKSFKSAAPHSLLCHCVPWCMSASADPLTSCECLPKPHTLSLSFWRSGDQETLTTLSHTDQLQLCTAGRTNQHPPFTSADQEKEPKSRWQYTHSHSLLLDPLSHIHPFSFPLVFFNSLLLAE